MQIEILEETTDSLTAYAQVPIAFLVTRVLETTVQHSGLGGIQLTERALANPYMKDYDAIAGEGPTRWARRWDLSNWGILAAYTGGQRVGGAVVAYDMPGVTMLEGRRDLAVLWDLRVTPEQRGRGIGQALFRHAERWSSFRGCHQLKVETQNINVPACKFYVRQGCVLGTIQRFAYPSLPHEVRLLWYKELTAG